MNDYPHFKSLVAVTSQEYICTKCGWIFIVTHHDGMTVNELIGKKEEGGRYVVIPDRVVRALNLKAGDKIDFELGHNTEHGRFVKVTKHDDEIEKLIKKYTNGKPFEFSEALRKALEEWKKKHEKE